MGLWGFEWQARQDPNTGEDRGCYTAAPGTRWEWWRVGLRVLATPVTIAADGVVALGKVAVFGDEDSPPLWLALLLSDDDDDDHGGCRPHRRACSGGGHPPEGLPTENSRPLGRPLVSGVRR